MQTISRKQIINHRYHLLKALGKGGMGVVYRAQDRLMGQDVALKYVTVEQNMLNFSNSTHGGDLLVALADEFRLLATLRHPNIISVLDYGFDKETNHPFYTMELLESAQNILQAGSSLGLRQKVALLVQVLQALIYLHRRGILHRDLKPDNILVIQDGDDLQVKVLDFGLAIRQDEQSDMSDSVVGTLAYMPPETLLKGIFSKESDLYSFGMIAYELLNGVHPFAGKVYQELIHAVIHTVPDVESLDVPEPLTMVLARLLSKDVQDRFADGRDILKVYADFTGLHYLYETVAVRESFLQGAEFVGRREELTTLIQRLDDAQTGKGALILIGGESGVGKSRLLSEIRTQTLVRGIQVVNTQAIKEGGVPFYIWRDIFKRTMLLVATQPTPENLRHASVLKPFINEIGELFDQPQAVPDPAPLEPNTARERLLSTVETLLYRLRDEAIPMLIILEDLHWLTSESLNLLQHLQSILIGLPILIVGSYRNDEAPHLPQDLPHAEVISLKRLSISETEKLSRAMLGDAVAKPELVSLLHQETEGNAYFLVEVVRTLAEEAGSLEDIKADRSFSRRVFAGGIQTVIKRRLEKLTPADYDLLTLMAVVGREINLWTLNYLTDDSAGWLLRCSDSAVIEWYEDTWRFSHDKFRDYLIQKLLPESLKVSHQCVAEILERGDTKGQEVALAYHWGVAENIAKEQHYTLLAGEQAVSNGAGKEGINYLMRVLEIGGISAEQQAHVHYQLALAHYSIGNLQLSLDHSRQSLKQVGIELPTRTTQVVVGIINQILQHLIVPFRRLKQPRHISPSMLKLATRVCIHMGQVLFLAGKRLETAHIAFLAGNLAENTGKTPELVRGYSIVTYVYVLIGLFRMADRYSKKTLDVIEEIGDAPASAFSYLILGVYFGSIGRLQMAQNYLHLSFKHFDEIGDHRRKREALAMTGLIATLAGNFDESKSLRLQLRDISARSNDIQSIGWSYSNLGEIGLLMGDFDLSIEYAQKRVDIISSFPDDLDASTTAYSILALAQWRNGQHELGAETAIQAIEHIRTVPSSRGLYTLIGYGILAELMLEIWEKHPDSTQRATFQILADEAIAMFKTSTSDLITGKAWYYRCVGMRHWLNGNRSQAKKWWEKALKLAQATEMRYEEAHTRARLAQHFIENPQQKRAELQKVHDTFKQLGASYDVQQISKSLL